MPAELPSQPEQAPPVDQASSLPVSGLSQQAAAGEALPAPSPHDVALEAIVYEVHPALAPRNWAAEYRYGNSAYPYDTPQPAGDNPFQVRPQDVYRPPPIFKFDFQPPAPAEYVVPQRFGMSAILGITTALAILFGAMHWLSAEPGWYLFLGAQSIIICLVQMFHGKAPRQASVVAGAIIAPLFVLGAAWFSRELDAFAALCFMVASVPFGAFIGYLNGTCAAGIFLVMDKAEKYFRGEHETPHTPAAAPPAGAS
jgi:hypothetical protein